MNDLIPSGSTPNSIVISLLEKIAVYSGLKPASSIIINCSVGLTDFIKNHAHDFRSNWKTKIEVKTSFKSMSEHFRLYQSPKYNNCSIFCEIIKQLDDNEEKLRAMTLIVAYYRIEPTNAVDWMEKTLNSMMKNGKSHVEHLLGEFNIVNFRRKSQIKHLTKRPIVFIGCSSKGLDIAQVLQEYFYEEANVIILIDQVFAPIERSFDTLLKSLDKADFAILVLTPDDLVLHRTDSKLSPRDNVIFDIGLFVGRLGRTRTFIVINDDDDPSISLPSDISGIGIARFRKRQDGNIRTALGPTTEHIWQQIQTAIQEEHIQHSQTDIKQYTCFISYNSHDKEFAERIYCDLQDVGIRCWLDSKDMKIGDRIDVQINKAIQVSDKVLLILSEASVNSEWVKREIDITLSKESHSNKTVLFPIRIDNAVMNATDEASITLVQSKHIGDFTKWSVLKYYRYAFTRLVMDLTTCAAAEEDREVSYA